MFGSQITRKERKEKKRKRKEGKEKGRKEGVCRKSAPYLFRRKIKEN